MFASNNQVSKFQIRKYNFCFKITRFFKVQMYLSQNRGISRKRSFRKNNLAPPNSHSAKNSQQKKHSIKSYVRKWLVEKSCRRKLYQQVDRVRSATQHLWTRGASSQGGERRCTVHCTPRPSRAHLNQRLKPGYTTVHNILCVCTVPSTRLLCRNRTRHQCVSSLPKRKT